MDPSWDIPNSDPWLYLLDSFRQAPGNVFEDRLYHSMMSRGPRGKSVFSRHATFNHQLITDMNRKKMV